MTSTYSVSSFHTLTTWGSTFFFVGKFYNEAEVEGKCFNCKESASVPDLNRFSFLTSFQI